MAAALVADKIVIRDNPIKVSLCDLVLPRRFNRVYFLPHDSVNSLCMNFFWLLMVRLMTP